LGGWCQTRVQCACRVAGSGWSNASSHRATAVIAGSRPEHTRLALQNQGVSGLLANVSLRSGLSCAILPIVDDFRVPTLALSPPERGGGEHHGRGEQYLVAKIVQGGEVAGSWVIPS